MSAAIAGTSLSALAKDCYMFEPRDCSAMNFEKKIFIHR